MCYPVVVAKTLQREIVDNDADGRGWMRRTHLSQRPDKQQLEERCCESTPWDDSAQRFQRTACWTRGKTVGVA